MKELKLSKDQITQIVAGFFFGGLFLFLYFNYFWLPLGKKIEEGRNKIASIESDIAKAKSLKAKYKNLEAKLADLQVEKEAAQKKLPRERKFPDLLKTVDRLALRHRVQIRSVSQPATSQVEYFIKVSYSVTAAGSYHTLGRFLTALALEERILSAENLNLNVAITDEGSLNATFTLVAYQYNG
jgi:type IV pilus assembly protein PilO